MKKNIPRLARLSGGALILFLSLSAAAQMGPGGMPGMRGGPHQGGPEAGRSGPPPASPIEMLTNQLLQARLRLLISREQAPAWERFYGALMAVHAHGAPRPGDDVQLTAQQAMQLQLTGAKDRYARSEDLADALRELLGKLDDKQKQVADEVLPRLLLAPPEGGRPGAGMPPRG
ncbi:hypothetical protein HHL11_27205 [Ramlibacter sp. G-1-2-2]|uniref:LTXXQ motif family protein n=1 Tax=Ramlibacter agri TaxID=2728837 RepID=A0A848HID5_9BURK|nr:hypothetical protein [Ramlibacter agri]NML47468.1 hypothetical protein [Ramlibacter agri]